ncbi:hypothetical protein SAMN05444004_12144 [Jannaschia faecimaris]|uniref:Uncharacterized protein n=2 Tax=Jannaschia faecimaris TaxID=1244108 RepID=A0A1H3U227_9RHOB|nr:hypothetical protein SAMN05444004_12144 [Jannaschia faecimaris]
MIALGAGLVADDLAVLNADGQNLMVEAPANAPAAMELRGLGIIPMALSGPANLVAFLYLGIGAARLPEPEMTKVCDRPVAVLRHPASPDLAAKLMLWLRARDAIDR